MRQGTGKPDPDAWDQDGWDIEWSPSPGFRGLSTSDIWGALGTMEFQDPFPKPYVFIDTYILSSRHSWTTLPQACQGELRQEHTCVIHYLSEPWQNCTKAKTRNVDLLA